MTNLKAKEPHYIRCIKPNEVKQPLVINEERLQHQVRSSKPPLSLLFLAVPVVLFCFILSVFFPIHVVLLSPPLSGVIAPLFFFRAHYFFLSQDRNLPTCLFLFLAPQLASTLFHTQSI